MIYIGFDFSIKKPACTVVDGDEISYFCWPVDVKGKTITILKSANVMAVPFETITTSKEYSDAMRDSVRNAEALSKLICETLEPYLKSDKKVVVAQEGFSYNSKGSSILDLAGYKYILMSQLRTYIPLKNMFTYAPITVKKTANCAKKGSTKEDMIQAFKDDSEETIFKRILIESPNMLRKKTNYVECVDDIVDSYWVCKTLINDLNNKLKK